MSLGHSAFSLPHRGARPLPHRLARPIAVLALLVTTAPAPAGAPGFELTYTPEARPGPVSARVYVMLGPARRVPGRREPRFGPDWFRPQPVFAVDAKGWKAGEPLRVGADAVGYPGPVGDLE